ncbi:MAG: AraC family transcriptional regulator, partial [Roseovarius sp.]|nr:AraC family transcriptional regulator [Roseovarius sp.]
MAPMRAVLMGAAALAAAAILSLWRLQEPDAPPPVATAEFPAAAPHPQTVATPAESAAAPETPMAGAPGAASAP